MLEINLENDSCITATTALRNELHLTDVSLYKEVYSQTSTYLKDEYFYDAFLTPNTVFTEADPSLHKARRRVLNPFFSRGGVMKLEVIIEEKIDLFVQKLRRLSLQRPIEVSYACR